MPISREFLGQFFVFPHEADGLRLRGLNLKERILRAGVKRALQ